MGNLSRFAALFLPLLAWPAVAQDTRLVTEPKIPPVCTTLKAALWEWSANNRHGDLTAEGNRDADDPASHAGDTARIQKALNGCSPGHAVKLASNDFGQGLVRSASVPDATAFLSGPLQLRDGVTLLVDDGVTLYASRDPADYETFAGNDDPAGASKVHQTLCGTWMPRPSAFPTFSTDQKARPKGGCRPFISAVNVKNAGIMGKGTIDGRGYAKLIGHDYSWWEMARQAEPHDDLYYSVKLISADHADGFTLYGIHLLNAMNYHVIVNHTDGFTAWGVHLQTPVDKTLDARNTDGIDPGTSTNITIAHSWIDNGDDNIAVKQGVSHMSVLDNHFYNGHGMSIGSETVLGQSFLLVDGLTEDHTTSGIRIKSNVMRGGPVHDLTYRNVCMRDVPIPIAISPYYTNQTVEPFEDPKYKGDKIPDYKSIHLENIWSATSGDVLITGLDDAHRTGITLDAVHIDGIQPKQIHLAFDDITYPACSPNYDRPGNDVLGGRLPSSVKVTATGKAACGMRAMHILQPCAGKFVPMQ